MLLKKKLPIIVKKQRLKILKNLPKLQKQIVEYISTIKKKDGSDEYKASSVKQAVYALNRHLLHYSSIPHINLHDKYMFSDLHDVLHGKLRNLQEHGFGEKSGEAKIISIPGDNNGPCSDIQFYLSKQPPSADENFYLQTNPCWTTGITSNHSGRKTATQILQDQEVFE
ncbi:hypothetical protein C1645_837765 [Glomus cerebriforme]|uniref:Uncharacterized protein n=1 Tax=Glomus cerebriforme TaxID=658196 RepID=A0A397S3J3_9GLOM|nr:hypothetical protein C1645_837765 [Glomus cerebriforme]